MRSFLLVTAVIMTLFAGRASAGQAATSVPLTATAFTDLLRAIRNRPPAPPPDPTAQPNRMFVFAPVIGAKPDQGVLFGAAGNIARYFGDPATTHISTTVLSATISQHGQVHTSARLT